MHYVLLKKSNNVPHTITTEPACILDKYTGMVMSIDDVEVLYARISIWRDKYIEKYGRWRAHYLAIIMLPLDQNFIDRLMTKNCKEVIKEIL